MRGAAAGAALWCAVAATGCATEAFEYRRIVMGAECRIVLHAPDRAAADDAARAAYARLAEVEESLSDWLATSEVRSLPTAPGRTVEVSPILAEALAASFEASRASGGAFDPSMGALTKLWRAARRDGRVPGDAEQAACRARCGIDAVRFDRGSATYAVTRDGIELDFGGIGQGIGADAALAALRDRGIASALVDLSGDVAVSDAPPGSDGWRVELDDPWRTVLLLSNAAVTTSGDRFQHLDVQDPAGSGTLRLSHVLDPATGRPLTTRTEVTVVAPTGTEADAWATALSVTGPVRGEELLRDRRALSARWRLEVPGNPVRATDGWPAPARPAKPVTPGRESPRLP